MRGKVFRRTRHGGGVLLLLVPGKLALLAASAVTVLAVVALRPPALTEGSASRFVIAAVASGTVAPGAAVPVDLLLTNPNPVRLAVTNLTARIDGVRTDSSCTPQDFAVTQFSGRYGFVVAANATRTLSELGLDAAAWPHVQLVNRPANQDGCKGATIVFRLSGSAVGVR